jgi:hypothetical protein
MFIKYIIILPTLFIRIPNFEIVLFCQHNSTGIYFLYAVHDCFKHAGGHDIFLLDWRVLRQFPN